MLVKAPDVLKDESFTFSYLKQACLALERANSKSEQIDFVQ